MNEQDLMSNLVWLKQSQLKPLREKLLKEQNYICPITNEILTMDNSVVDHLHRLFKAQPIGENGAGQIRSVILATVNSFEGKVFNNYRRMGLHKLDMSLSNILRKLADYYERPKLPLIHPSEAPKPEKLGKRLFNQLSKMYTQKYPKRKSIQYPKSGKMTKKISKLLIEFDLIREIALQKE